MAVVSCACYYPLVLWVQILDKEFDFVELRWHDDIAAVKWEKFIGAAK